MVTPYAPEELVSTASGLAKQPGAQNWLTPAEGVHSQRSAGAFFASAAD